MHNLEKIPTKRPPLEKRMDSWRLPWVFEFV